MIHFLLFIVFFVLGQSAQAPNAENYWVIWNVGQGQWITQVTHRYCRHFDFGGEIQYFKNIQKKFLDRCQKKENILYLSHADLDHYSFLTMIANRSKSVCWMARPEHNLQSQQKIPMCKNLQSPTGEDNQTIINDCNFKDKNSCSTVFKRDRFLLPGDSPKSQEKKWSRLLENRQQIKVLVLGHHGSRTSTKADLIERLTHLKMAVASARKKKYGHPHFQTEQTLRRRSIPLLKTESWGNLVFL